MKTKFYAVVTTKPIGFWVWFYPDRAEAIESALADVAGASRAVMRKADGEVCVKVYVVPVSYTDPRELASKAATIGLKFRTREVTPVLGAEIDEAAQAKVDQAWEERLKKKGLK